MDTGVDDGHLDLDGQGLVVARKYPRIAIKPNKNNLEEPNCALTQKDE